MITMTGRDTTGITQMRTAPATYALLRRLRRRTTALATQAGGGVHDDARRRVLEEVLFELRAAAFEVNAALAASAPPSAEVDDG